MQWHHKTAMGIYSNSRAPCLITWLQDPKSTKVSFLKMVWNFSVFEHILKRLKKKTFIDYLESSHLRCRCHVAPSFPLLPE